MTKKEQSKLDKYYSRYGINYFDYCEMAKNGCHLCGKFPKPGQRRYAVDHAHYGDKKTRGILCYYCNKFRVGKLTFEWAFKVCEYLQKYE